MKLNKLIALALIGVSFSAFAATPAPVEKNDSYFNLPKLHDVYVAGDILSLKHGKFAQDVKTGASLNKNIYLIFEGEHNPDYDFGTEETIGFQKSFGRVTPYVEANYRYDGKVKFKDWKTNAGYDFGMNVNFTPLYSAGVESEDTFDNRNRSYKVAAGYNLNKNWAVGMYYQTKPKDADSAKLGLSARYNF